MGYMVHHAIIVTAGEEDIKKIHRKAKRIFEYVSPISPVAVNGYQSFFIPPDGSKEGWDPSDQGDLDRETFLDYLEKQRYKDGSTSLDYAEVQFGDEGGNDKILQSSNVIGEIV